MVPTEEYYSNLMTVNDYLDQEKLKSQSSTAMAWLGRHNDYLDNMRATYNAGSNTDMLGKTYKGICQQCSGYVSVIDVLKTANDCDIADHEYMLAVLGAMTFDGSAIIPAAIEAHKNEDDERAAAASDRSAAASANDPETRDMYNSSADSHDSAADSYKAEWELMEKYMRRFHRVNVKTKDLFILGNEYRKVGRNGLDSIAWTFNSETNEYAAADDTWKKDLKTLDEKLYQVYVSHAKEIGESWTLDDACKMIQKDADEISAQEYMALCYKYDAMSYDEIEIFVDSAYSKVKYWPPQMTSYTDGGMYGKGFIQYEVSSSFSKFTNVYCSINNTKNECFDNDKLFRANVLYLINEVNPTLYMVTDTEDCNKNLGINITRDDLNGGVLEIEANCHMGDIKKAQKYQINDYSDKLTGDINITIKDCDRPEGNVNEQLLVQGVQYGIGQIPGIGTILDGMDFLQTYVDDKVAREEYETEENYLDMSEALQDLEVSATVINRRDEGNYGMYFTNINYKSVYVQTKIDDWNENHKDKTIDCSPDDLVLSVLGKSDAVDQDILAEFIGYI